jgi:hypothetical protein
MPCNSGGEILSDPPVGVVPLSIHLYQDVIKAMEGFDHILV